jgi:hypothetical protein
MTDLHINSLNQVYRVAEWRCCIVGGNSLQQWKVAVGPVLTSNNPAKISAGFGETPVCRQAQKEYGTVMPKNVKMDIGYALDMPSFIRSFLHNRNNWSGILMPVESLPITYESSWAYKKWMEHVPGSTTTTNGNVGHDN